MAFDEGMSNSDFHIAEQVRRKELGENGRKRRTRVRGPHRRADYRGRVGLGSAGRQSGAGYRPGRQAALHAGRAPSLWTAPTGRVWAPRKGNSGGQVRSSGVELCRAGRGPVQHDHTTRQVERIIEEDKFMVSYFRCIFKKTCWRIDRVLK